MKNIKPQSLSQRITRGVLIMSIANVFFVMVLLIIVRPVLIETMSSEYITKLGSYLKNDIKFTLLVQDHESTKQYLEEVSNLPWINSISLLDNNGVVQQAIGTSNWTPTRFEFDTENTQYQELKTRGSIVHKIETIYSEETGGETVVAGLLHISVNSVEFSAKVDNALYYIITALILGSILLWYFMRTFAIKSTKTIIELNATINMIKPDSSDIKPITMLSDIIEIANVVKGVNALLSRILTNNSELENRVNDRTRELINALESNRRSDAVRRSLIMNLSHDLKTPLTSNMMYLDHAIELIEEGETLESTVLPILMKSRNSSLELRNEVRTLLQYSTSADNSENLASKEFNLADTIQSSIDSTIELCKASKNTVSYHHSGKESVNLPKQLIVYIVDNLLTNAHKACQNGMISINTDIDPHNLMTLIMHDIGIGIPLDEQEHIFEKHFQVEHIAHAGPRGMGIGLSLVRFWVDQLGGSIQVDSIEGEYTEFTVRIAGRIN